MKFALLNPLLALFFLGAVISRAEPPPNARVRLEPVDLFPVDPYCSEQNRKYIQFCHKLLHVADFEATELFGTYKRGTVVMVKRPSFEPEECIALRERNGEGGYDLNHTQADCNIYYSISDDAKNKKSVDVKIRKTVKPLDKGRAERVYNLWSRMLMRVRYPEEGTRAGCPDDGETLEFRCAWKGMYGETCSPSRGSPKLLADLGNALILYCKSQNDQSEHALMQVDRKCDELELLLNADDRAKESR